MKRKRVMERIGDFMAGKGFYIVLFLCVAAIGISGYYLLSGIDFGGEDAAVAGHTQVMISAAPTERVPDLKTPPAPAPTATPVPTVAPTPAPTAQPTGKPPARKTVYTWPVKGEIISDFSLEVLAYDPTMGDWRVHSGIDIAADMGASVTALTSGTVESVTDDGLMGTMVTIDHGDGLKSVYANLAAVPTVKAGDKVSTGGVIGSVGKTAIAEISRPSHLHFEVLKDGVSVDPSDYLP